MPAKKKTVSSPLQLLEQLSRSLVEHLEKACADAQKEAQGLLAKLEKQRGKARDKLVRAQAKLDDADAAGKTKTQSKRRARIDELENAVALLDARQREILTYLADLHRDSSQSLKLAEGIRRVEQAAAQAVAGPAKPTTSATPARSRQSGAAVKAAVSKTTAIKAAAEAKPVVAAVTKPRATRPTTSRARPAAAKSPEGEVKPAPAKKPAPRKPAAHKPASTTQTPDSSN